MYGPGGAKDRALRPMGRQAMPALLTVLTLGASRPLPASAGRVSGPTRGAGASRSVALADRTADSSWILPSRGGAYIEGRWYTEHALERMAPRTPEVMAILERRAMDRALAKGLQPGTPKFEEWWELHHPDPRGISPSVVEAEITNSGTTGVRAIVGNDGQVISVIPE